MKTILSTSIRTALFAAAAICTTTLAPAAALSEMLEKGIYAEETKGDLDAAITIYQQVLAESKSSQALAARAQFRLGQCYLKKNRTTDAVAAFEKLVKDHPGEKELVAAARKHLPGEIVLGPVPWVDGEVMHMALKLPTGMDIGTYAYYVKSSQVGGRKTWQVGARMYAGFHAASRVEVGADHFRPITSWFKHGMLGEVTADYGQSEVTLKRTDANEPTKIPVDGTVYDNEQAVHLIRRLPLETGYKSTMPIVSSLTGGMTIPIGIEVKARETVKVPAGEWECFKVELIPLAQTYWISTDAKRAVVKIKLGGVTADLIAIEQRLPGVPVTFKDAAMGVTVTAPEDWLIHKQDPDDDEDAETIYLLDPLAQADICMVRVRPLATLSAGEQASARAFADSQMAQGPKMKGLKVREASWTAVVVDGKPGVSVIADYEEQGKPKVIGSVFALGATGAQQFTLAATPEEFPKMQSAFENIVASFKSTK